MAPDAPLPSIVTRAAGAVIAAITIFALFWAREIIIPVVLAIFFSLLLSPLVRRIEQLGIRRIGSVLIVMTALMGLIAGVFWVIGSQAAAVMSELPKYRDNIVAKARNLHFQYSTAISKITSAAENIRSEAANAATRPAAADLTPENDLAAANGARQPLQPTSLPIVEEAEPIKVEVVSRESQVWALLRELAMPVVHPIATIGVVIVFVAFFLIYREELRDRVVRACGRANINLTTLTLSDAGARVSQFFVAQVIANLTVGAAIGLGLYVFGIPHAALWGLMAALLRFIPYLGPVLAAVFPVAMCLAMFDGWVHALFVIGWTLLVDVLSANFVEPWLFGSRVGASPTAIIVGFVFWGWLWGGIGLILATPITVCLITLGRYIPAMELFYVLLGNEQVLEPELRFYQRLLALDRREAVADAKRYADQHGVHEMVDQLLSPVLAQIEQDRLNGMLDERRVANVREVVGELAEFIRNDAEVKSSEAGAAGPERRDLWVIVPDTGAFDGCVSQLLAAVARWPEDRIHALSPDALSTDIVEHVRQTGPNGVALVAIEPSGTNRILNKTRRLEMAGFADLIHVVLIGTWKARHAGNQLARKIERAPVLDRITQLAAIMQRREARLSMSAADRAAVAEPDARDRLISAPRDAPAGA
ncbi:MAG: AI-2E family transporter [Phycisphaerales bacterium]|nr:AI-2E family transporter [Phycisphaerales bacterium]